MFTDPNIYHQLDKVKNLKECFTDFNIYKLVNTLSDEPQQNLSDDFQYWFSIFEFQGKKIYKTNIIPLKEDVDEIKNNNDPFYDGEWHFIKFYSSNENINNTISKEIKKTFQQQIKLIKDLGLIEASVHIISKGTVIPQHKDMPHIPENHPSGRKNLIINIKTPADNDEKNIAFRVGEEIQTPKENSFILFDANDFHGAWNFSKEQWIMCVLHIDYKDLNL